MPPFLLLIIFVLQIIFKINLFHPESAPVMHFCRIKYCFGGVFAAHGQTFVINSAQSVFPHIFAGKNEVSVFVFAFYVKTFVRGVEKLHYFELFFRVSVKTVHIIAAFSTLFAFTRDFVADFFAYKM